LEAILVIGGPGRDPDMTTRSYVAANRLEGVSRVSRRNQLTVLVGALAFFVVVLIVVLAVL
jgi:hypothetical protein